MLLKAALLASSLATYATSINFDYQVRCDYVVEAIASRVKLEEKWFTTERSRSSFNSFGMSMSAAAKKGLISGNVAFAMNTVRKATSYEKVASFKKFVHADTFQPGSKQVHRLCKYSVYIDGQIIQFQDKLYIYSETGAFKSQEQYEAEARKWMNDNIVIHLKGAQPITRGTTLILNYGVNMPALDGWTDHKDIEVTAGLVGTWTPLQMCPRDHYVVSAKVRIEKYQGASGMDDDDSGVNGFQAECQHVKTKRDARAVLGGKTPPMSVAGYYGDWTIRTTCPRGSFIIGMRAMMEPSQGNGQWADDTAMNGLAMACRYSVVNDRDGEGAYPELAGQYGMTTADLNHYTIANHNWGAWTNWATCPYESYMCGFSVRIDHGEIKRCGGGCDDDTGMNGIRITCCKMPWDVDTSDSFTDRTSADPISSVCGSDAVEVRAVNGRAVCSFNMNGETWQEASNFCSGRNLRLASKADVLGFRSGAMVGDVWTPLSEETNEWLQIGQLHWTYGKLTSSFGKPRVTWPEWGNVHQVTSYKKLMYCVR